MTLTRLAKIEEYFHKALTLSRDERPKFLAEVCGNDEALRHEIELLLNYKERSRSPLADSVVTDAVRAIVEVGGESLIGMTLGHYWVRHRIGVGGMGEIYEAEDQRLNRKVAIKLLPSYLIKDKDQVRRLEREAQTASSLNHPNIVTIYELGQAEGVNFIAMEFIEGQTLRDRMSVPIPLHEILNIAIQIASGLAAAHQAGVLHRDIKPENVMFGGDGFVKVLDFGIAKFNQQQRAMLSHKASPELSLPAGTLSYMSPEQAQGKPLDGRTDIFSLGVLLFEMITGSRPFDRDTQLDKLDALIDANEAPMLNALYRDIPNQLQRIVEKALKKNRDERYESTAELLTDLREFDRSASEELNETQRANRMLRQYLSIYAVDKRALIPLTKLQFIRRHSDMERGTQTRELLHRSVGSGLIKIVLVMVSLLLLSAVSAAFFSQGQIWESRRLNDGHQAATRRAIFSPDGKLLVSVGEDGKIIVWDFATRNRMATLADESGVVTTVGFSPDGKRFATAGKSGIVSIWDAERFVKITDLKEHRSAVNSVAFSSDGKILATASEKPDFRTIVWNASTWTKVREFDTGLGYGNLIFSPNSDILLSTTEGKYWELNGGRMSSLEGSISLDWQVLSKDGNHLVGINPAGSIFFWEATPFSKAGRYRLVGQQRGHNDNGRAVAYSPDNRFIASGSEDIVLWDAVTRTKLAHLKYPSVVWSVEFSPDGLFLVATYGDGAILLWDVSEREVVANFGEHSGPVRAVAYSSDGKRIASASEDHSVAIWNSETGQKEANLIGHKARVLAVAFSPDGQWLASCDFDNTIIRWDLKRKRAQWIIRPGAAGSTAIAITRDGRWLITSIGILDGLTGSLVVSFVDREGIPANRPQVRDGIPNIYGAAVSNDGHWLACVSDQGLIVVFDLASHQEGERVLSTNASFISVSFSPDNKSIVTGDDEGRVRLWSVQPLREVAQIGHHASRVKSVAISPDGREVASAGDDSQIYLWDISKRRLITNIGTYTAPVLSVAFSPDGKKLVAGGYDNSLRVFTRHRTLWSYSLD